MASITASYSTVVLDRKTRCQKADGAAFLPTDEVRIIRGRCYYFDEDTVTIFSQSTATIHEIPKTREPKLPNMQWDGSR